MTYSEKYPLYIKSADYGVLDVTGAATQCVVTYADDSVVTYTTEAEILAVGIQIGEQQAALNAGETISFSPNK